jgi:hypothetical protein
VLDITGSLAHAEVRCLLPKGAKAKRVRIGTRDLPFSLATIERSVYAVFTLAALPSTPVVITY